MKHSKALLVGIASLLLIAADAPPQFAYPAQGQSPQRQAKDEADCGQWAVGNTGYDPARPPPIPVAHAAPVTGSGARVAGAAAGAGIGAVAGGDVGEAALAGAVAGGVVRRARNRRAAAEQNAVAAQQAGAGLAAYRQARSACLTGRGYTVR